MEQGGDESKLLGGLSEVELDSVFDRAVTPPRGSAVAMATERLPALLTEVKRLTDDERLRVQALAGAGEWFLEGTGTPLGPLTTAQMRDRWLAHASPPETRCWGAGLPGWMPLCRI